MGVARKLGVRVSKRKLQGENLRKAIGAIARAGAGGAAKSAAIGALSRRMSGERGTLTTLEAKRLKKAALKRKPRRKAPKRKLTPRRKLKTLAPKRRRRTPLKRGIKRILKRK